ncbi:TPM domain-containing protein [Streptomyces sp. AV19]|uniref:TPM domain-containing protein n=1 Tax=Streptomyces sp. AV19 TaxID=2793068 RepID=UPI0018FED95B|nr:TPM domain-containing protein [Streptomyces sp. AV19]MBH1935618.1 TPM domain-containing protein [Streptomyces sp. AV19]MDG4534505.1 TPM domain-containing protein [Streptomyces sp. AV19]
MTRLLRRYGPGAPGWAMLGALFALYGALLLATPPAARAETPLDLEAGGRVTDTVGALGRRRSQVEAALARLAAQRVQLYVTYVRDFSGRAGHDWADATADRNGLGPHDVLLAIATYPRQFAVSAAQDSGFRAEQLAQVASVAIAPALKEHDWAGAAIGAADGYRSVLSGQPVRTPVIVPGRSDPGGSGLLPGDRRFWIPAACGTLLILAGLYLRGRRARRRPRPALPPPDPPLVATTTPPGLARMVQPLTPLPELDAEAARGLVGTDDAVRTSAEELPFALAQLGEDAVRPFAEAVAYARQELAGAFRLRQRLDDAPVRDDDFRRHALDEICSRCTSANRRLDAEAAAFDRLRGLTAHATLVLDRAEAVARSLAPRIDTARAALDAVAGRCTPAALAPAEGYPAEARDRLAFAEAALAEAHAALDGGEPERAAVSVRAAEGALSQARTLATAALRHAYELGGAARRMASALVDAEAAAAVSDGPGARLLAAARREAACERIDPRAVLRRIDEAAAALDEACPGTDGERAARARARAGRAVLAARGEVAGARDFVATHRGAVGSRARTRLAEAERHLSLARPPDGSLPPSAAADAERAEALARAARRLAERDVDAYGVPPEPESPSRALGGALLGGIVLAGLLPATFGGGATRGRLAARGE